MKTLIALSALLMISVAGNFVECVPIPHSCTPDGEECISETECFWR